MVNKLSTLLKKVELNERSKLCKVTELLKARPCFTWIQSQQETRKEIHRGIFISLFQKPNKHKWLYPLTLHIYLDNNSQRLNTPAIRFNLKSVCFVRLVGALSMTLSDPELCS